MWITTYYGWKYEALELASPAMNMWSTNAKAPDGNFHIGIAYPMLGEYNNRITVFARTRSRAERKVQRIIRKEVRRYR